MTRVRVPIEWADAVEQAGRDFDRVTRAWVRDGWHTVEEVEEWRKIIVMDMRTANGANSAIDDRSHVERIRAWCKTWRGLAVALESKGV